MISSLPVMEVCVSCVMMMTTGSARCVVRTTSRPAAVDRRHVVTELLSTQPDTAETRREPSHHPPPSQTSGPGTTLIFKNFKKVDFQPRLKS